MRIDQAKLQEQARCRQGVGTTVRHVHAGRGITSREGNSEEYQGDSKICNQIQNEWLLRPHVYQLLLFLRTLAADICLVNQTPLDAFPQDLLAMELDDVAHHC